MARRTHREVQPAYQRLGTLPPRTGSRLNAREESWIGCFDENGEVVVPRNEREMPGDD